MQLTNNNECFWGDYNKILTNVFGYESFTSSQTEVLASVGKGVDTLSVMPTGGGKSLTFQVPALCASGLTVVIVPILALMTDQVDALNLNAPNSARYINGSSETECVDEIMTEIRLGGVKLLYLSPETFNKENFMLRICNIAKVEAVIIDEAHCLVQWGATFRKEYLAVKDTISTIEQFNGRVQVNACTATATPMVRHKIERLLNRKMTHIVKGVDRPNIFFQIKRYGAQSVSAGGLKDKLNQHIKRINNNSQATNQHDKIMGALVNYLNNMPSEKNSAVIVYALTKKRVEQVYKSLNELGYNCAYFHGGLTYSRKDKVLDAFLKDDVQIVVATKAFGLGVDKANVREVIHVDLPMSMSDYYQEAGRGGRDGLQAYATILFDPDITPNKARSLITNCYFNSKEMDEYKGKIGRYAEELGWAVTPDDRVLQEFLKVNEAKLTNILEELHFHGIAERHVHKFEEIYYSTYMIGENYGDLHFPPHLFDKLKNECYKEADTVLEYATGGTCLRESIASYFCSRAPIKQHVCCTVCNGDNEVDTVVAQAQSYVALEALDGFNDWFCNKTKIPLLKLMARTDVLVLARHLEKAVFGEQDFCADLIKVQFKSATVNVDNIYKKMLIAKVNQWKNKVE